MKILAVLVLIFGLVVPTLADDITVPNGLLIIPAGSQVTGVFIVEGFGGFGLKATGVDFSFADGTGATWGEANDGDTGFMNFTVPLTSLTINWVGTRNIPLRPLAVRDLAVHQQCVRRVVHSLSRELTSHLYRGLTSLELLV